MSAAANIAQNLVMTANARPEILPELAPGIVAAANLSRGMAFGDSAQVPLQKLQAEWQETVAATLRTAVAKACCHPTDAQGNPVDIERFIAERGKEIQAGVAQALAHPSPTPEKGQGR
jgi:hypothetical protein